MNKIINSPYNVNSVARLCSDNIVHNHYINNSPIEKVSESGFIIKEDTLVSRIDGINLLLASAAYLLLVQGNR